MVSGDIFWISSAGQIIIANGRQVKGLVKCTENCYERIVFETNQYSTREEMNTWRASGRITNQSNWRAVGSHVVKNRERSDIDYTI